MRRSTKLMVLCATLATIAAVKASTGCASRRYVADVKERGIVIVQPTGIQPLPAKPTTGR